jgi:hypothetical protein
MRRTVLAFAIAPVGAVVTYSTLLATDPFESLAASFAFLGIVAVASYVAELLIAVPVYAASDRMRNGGTPVWVLGGCVVGVVVAIVADLPEVNWLRWRPFAAAAAAGAASGAIFSLLMVWRPNRPYMDSSRMSARESRSSH